MRIRTNKRKTPEALMVNGRAKLKEATAAVHEGKVQIKRGKGFLGRKPGGSC